MKLLFSTLLLLQNVQAQAFKPWLTDECSADSECTTIYTSFKFASTCCGTATKNADFKDTNSKNFAADGVRKTKTTGKTGHCGPKDFSTVEFYFKDAAASAVDDRYTADLDTQKAGITVGYTFKCLNAAKAGSNTLLASTVTTLGALSYYLLQ